MHKNSRRLDFKDSTLTLMQLWLKRKHGRNLRQVKRGRSEATKMTDSSTRAKAMRSWSKISELEQIMQNQQSLKSWNTTKDILIDSTQERKRTKSSIKTLLSTSHSNTRSSMRMNRSLKKPRRNDSLSMPKSMSKVWPRPRCTDRNKKL